MQKQIAAIGILVKRRQEPLLCYFVSEVPINPGNKIFAQFDNCCLKFRGRNRWPQSRLKA
jgi:hypothetical protein